MSHDNIYLTLNFNRPKVHNQL